MVKLVLTGPPALTVNIMKNTESLSIVVQWDAVDDFLTTTYTILWFNESYHYLQVATLTEQTSYTITGLTLDTIYTIIVTAANRCGDGPEFMTSVLFPAGTLYVCSYFHSVFVALILLIVTLVCYY